MIHLRDAELDRQLDEVGYAVVRLLDDAALSALRRGCYEAFGDTVPVGFRASPVGRPAAQVAATSASIERVVGPLVDQVLVGGGILGAVYLEKGPGPAGRMDVHQDFSIVDEDYERSLNVWCALDDATPSSGCLLVAPGSHRWIRSVRSPAHRSVHVELDDDDVVARLVPVPVGAGEAVVYDHRLFHGSGSNESGRRRRVAQLGYAPTGVDLVMSFDAPDGRVELRNVPAWTFFGQSTTVAVDPAWPVVDVWPDTGSDEAVVRARLLGGG